MFEALDRMMLAGLGALSMTRQRAEEIFEEYVSQGQAVKENRTGFVKELMESASKTRQEFEKIIADQVKETVRKLELATREDLHRVEKKLDKLLKQES